MPKPTNAWNDQLYNTVRHRLQFLVVSVQSWSICSGSILVTWNLSNMAASTATSNSQNSDNSVAAIFDSMQYGPNPEMSQTAQVKSLVA